MNEYLRERTHSQISMQIRRTLYRFKYTDIYATHKNHTEKSLHASAKNSCGEAQSTSSVAAVVAPSPHHSPFPDRPRHHTQMFQTLHIRVRPNIITSSFITIIVCEKIGFFSLLPCTDLRHSMRMYL